MARRYHSRDEAVRIIAPHLGPLRDCYRRAWTEWSRHRNDHIRRGLHLSPSLRARYVYDLVTQHARRAFAGVAGVLVGERKRGFLTLTIDNQIVVRFKKLKSNLTTSSIPTRQACLFEAQGELPGLPSQATLLVAGYLLDPTGMDIAKLLVVCRDGERVVWCHEIDDAVGAVVQPMPAAEAPVQLPRLRSRIRRMPGAGGTA